MVSVRLDKVRSDVPSTENTRLVLRGAHPFPVQLAVARMVIDVELAKEFVAL
jgi:hypothetical protein